MAIIEDWKIRSRATRCCYSGEPFEDGEKFYTCLFEVADDFVRRDYSAKNWDLISKNLDPPPFSFWQSTFELPRKDGEPEPIEHKSAESMLRRMIDEDDPHTENARYILAVMLERKKLLKPVDEKETGARKLLFYEHRTTGDLFIVADPGLRLDQLGEVQEEVTALLRRDDPPAEAAGKDAPGDGEQN